MEFSWNRIHNNFMEIKLHKKPKHWNIKKTFFGEIYTFFGLSFKMIIN